jgi:hypothetical protein
MLGGRDHEQVSEWRVQNKQQIELMSDICGWCM